MAYTLRMPEVGETVTEGTIERWLKQPGERIEKYEPVVEINTDKVNVELPSPVTGTLTEIVAREGETVLVGAALAIIEEVAGEVPAEVAPRAAGEEPASAPAPAAAAPAPAAQRDEGARHRATPRVRRLAQELGVALEAVKGSGPGGRILEEDVRAAAKDGSRGAAAAPPAEPGADEESVALTSIRRTIAQRMAASKFSV